MTILDSTGNAMTPPALPPKPPVGSAVTERPRYHAALQGGSLVPYDAADPWNRDFAGWNAWLGSPDIEINPYRNVLVARIRDLVRNDGWASGAITKLLDAVIGGHLRLIAKPDWRALKAWSPRFDPNWAAEFGEAVEARWRGFADDPGRWCDVSRRLSFSEICRLGFRHFLIDGDAIAVSHWLPDRLGPGRAQYATCFQVMDPDRLSNPYMAPDRPLLRGGVEIDEYGAATGYHFRRAHQADWFVPERAYTWELVSRETAWGRPIVVHYFEHDRAAQHRAVGGVLKPIVGRLRMLGHYDSTELQAAVVNAVLAAYIESPFDHSLLAEGLEGASDEARRQVLWYQTDRLGFHRSQPLTLNGARLPMLYPGEKINTLAATRPTTNFGEFEAAALRNIASAIGGLASPQVSGNWSDVNYSSARAALLDAWKTMSRMRLLFGRGWATLLFANWLEEEFDRGELPLPQGAPDFVAARTAYSGCLWMGPGRGWVDPLNERRGAVLGMDAAIDTLEDQCAEQGAYWRDKVEQRAIEYREFERLGLPHPTWQSASDDAQQASAPPEAQ